MAAFQLNIVWSLCTPIAERYSALLTANKINIGRQANRKLPCGRITSAGQLVRLVFTKEFLGYTTGPSEEDNAPAPNHRVNDCFKQLPVV